MRCINCNKEHDENFCPHCGEKANIPPITLARVTRDFFSTITTMDKGFLFTVKQLFLYPNKLINGYLAGKRKNILNPVSFLIITITIYLIGDSFIEFDKVEEETTSEAFAVGKETGIFIKNHFKYFWILSVVWLSFATRMVFHMFNFAEHLAINSFVIGQSTLVGLLGLVVFKFPIIFNPVIYILMMWMLYHIFKRESKHGKVFLQSVIAVLGFFIALIGIAVLIGFINS